jgi:hypothetical protein
VAAWPGGDRRPRTTQWTVLGHRLDSARRRAGSALGDQQGRASRCRTSWVERAAGGSAASSDPLGGKHPTLQAGVGSCSPTSPIAVLQSPRRRSQARRRRRSLRDERDHADPPAGVIAIDGQRSRQAPASRDRFVRVATVPICVQSGPAETSAHDRIARGSLVTARDRCDDVAAAGLRHGRHGRWRSRGARRDRSPARAGLLPETSGPGRVWPLRRPGNAEPHIAALTLPRCARCAC